MNTSLSESLPGLPRAPSAHSSLPKCLRAPPSSFDGVPAGSQRIRRVLTYGDSLTAGYYAGGERFEPYGLELAKALAPEIHAEVWSCGLSGLTAELLAWRSNAESILDSCGRRGPGIARILASRGPFDLAVIMAGTNDLGVQDLGVQDLMVGPDVITSRIQSLHRACTEAGVPTVALSIPQSKRSASAKSLPQKRKDTAFSAGECVATQRFGLRRFDDADDNWTAVNSRLSTWATSEDPSRPQVLVDVSQIVPYPKEGAATDDELWKLWDEDGLHFSSEGSKVLGRSLAPLIAPLLCARASDSGGPASLSDKLVDSASSLRPSDTCTDGPVGVPYSADLDSLV